MSFENISKQTTTDSDDDDDNSAIFLRHRASLRVLQVCQSIGAFARNKRIRNGKRKGTELWFEKQAVVCVCVCEHISAISKLKSTFIPKMLKELSFPASLYRINGNDFESC